MSGDQRSPVLVQHSSPPHALSPELPVFSISNFPPEVPLDAPTTPLPPNQDDPDAANTFSDPLPFADSLPTEDEADTPMADAPPIPAETTAENPIQTLGTEPTPVTEQAAQPPSQEAPTSATAAANPPSTTETPPGAVPPPPRIAPPKQNIPEWVTWADDLSAPDEEELKEIEGTDADKSALDVPIIEKRVYQDVDDPEQRPIKKIRLSWVIKGIRGTRDRPNRARTMNSPCALIDGNYWQIKFFPRGNKSSSLSAYIKCSKNPPKPDAEVPESTFSYFEGTPDAHMGEGAEPVQVVTVPATSTNSETKDGQNSSGDEISQPKPDNDDSILPTTDPNASQDEDAQIREEGKSQTAADEDFRISAQLGMVIYNPAEPRTGFHLSSEHQFCKNNEDWGWTNFVGPWNEIHIRQRGQRQALLRNDTLAIDAYIRIFEDPSQALWWHSSHEHETQWPSKKLAGYFPMGTPPLYHSPAVAGITTWLLLAPFRKVLETVESGGWRLDSQIKPRPVLSKLQVVLYLMRSLHRGEYVNAHPVIEAMTEMGENYVDVKSFWEAFRRSVELELVGEDAALADIARVFDTSKGRFAMPTLPVKGIKDVQEGLSEVSLSAESEEELPNFLPLMLQREAFDQVTREWKMHHDRVRLNEELEVPLSKAGHPSCRYTLYGFMVHVGERKSGRFYSVLRPNGPGTKWLAFEDGDGNKVFSYTKRRIQDFEGLEGDDLKNFKSTRQTAYMVMYIKTSHLKDYLPGQLDSYELPEWLNPMAAMDGGLETAEADSQGNNTREIEVEIYHDEAISGRKGLLDMYNVKQRVLAGPHFHSMKLPGDTAFREVRRRLALEMQVDDVEKIRLFAISYRASGQYSSAQWTAVDLKNSIGACAALVGPLCLWSSFLKTEEQVRLFGVSDPAEDKSSEDKAEDGEAAASTTQNETATNPTEGLDIDAAAPDATEDSVHQAVTRDLEQRDAVMSDTQLPVQPTTADVPSTPATSPPPPSDLPEPIPVEHGHMVDAVMSEALITSSVLDVAAATVVADTITQVREAENLAGQRDVVTDNGAVIASLMAADAEAMDFIQEPPVNNERGDLTPTTASTESDVHRPVPNVYGFLQLFDADAQTFTMHSTFFARRDEAVKGAMRRYMGYDAGKEFHAWHRQTTLGVASVDEKVTFDDINFADGVDMVVGDVLSESKVEELRQQGKLSTPHRLSRFLRMLERNHPVQARTTTELVEIADFGTEYYKGPLVNGQQHGPQCVRIAPNGHIYEGPLVCGDKSGDAGKMTYQNGDVYEGGWLNDVRHGQGTFIEKRTGNKYVGGFQNGKRWGKGTTYWEVADEEAEMCQICYEEEIDALFYDCGHVCSCMECAKRCEVCPICRKSIRHVVKMFWA